MLAPWKKSYNNLESILKSRDITLPTKVHLVKDMVFLGVMYGYESWTIKKPECWRINAFEPWCWRRLLRVPWTARRSNQSILKEINPEYSLEGLTLNQYFSYLMQRAHSLEKTRCWERLKAGGKGDNRDEMVDGIIDSMDINLSKLWEMVKEKGQGSLACYSPWGQRVRDDWATEQQQ